MNISSLLFVLDLLQNQSLRMCTTRKLCKMSVIRSRWEVLEEGLYDYTKKERHTFDHTFDPSANTVFIFGSFLEPMFVTALNEGFNGILIDKVVNVMCYGENKSGKSYTLFGGKEVGVVQLVLQMIFGFVEANSKYKCLVRASFFQMINDSIFDLFSANKSSLELIEATNGEVKVKDLTEVVCTDFNFVFNTLNKINEMKYKGNSELICTFIVESRKNNNLVNISTINLIKLSDSSCSKITKNLNALNTVVQRLASNKKLSSPYERSRLTKYLQGPLSGNSKLAFICTMSPAFTSYEVSVNTLTFAKNVKTITVSPKRTCTKNLLDSFLLQYEEQYKSIKEGLLNSSNEMLRELKAAILVPGQLERNGASKEMMKEVKKYAKRILEVNLSGDEGISEIEHNSLLLAKIDTSEELKDQELKEVITFSAKAFFNEVLSEYSNQIMVLSLINLS